MRVTPEPEGELIFRYIVHRASPADSTALAQSMTTAAIREGFEQLRTDAQMRPLADAAVCRSEADWLVGINGTRAMTAFNPDERVQPDGGPRANATRHI
jgi:DNA topoisomerase-3